MILIGANPLTQAPTYCDLSDSAINRHMLILGGTGYGKTHALQVILSQLVQTDCRILILDLTGGLSRQRISPGLMQRIENRAAFHNVTQEGIPLKLFRQLQLDPNTRESISQAALRIIDILKPVFGRADQQAHIAYKYARRMMERSVTPPSLEQLCANLRHLNPAISDDMEAPSCKAAANKLSYVIDGGYINERVSEELFQKFSVELLQFQAVPKTVRKIIIDILLWELWSKTMNEGVPPLYVVVDEVQNLNLTENSPLYKYLTEGRQFGINCILATQSLTKLKNVESALLGAYTKICFRPAEGEQNHIADILSADSERQKHYRKQLSKLERGEAYVKGRIWIGDSPAEAPVKVSISSMDRFDKML